MSLALNVLSRLNKHSAGKGDYTNILTVPTYNRMARLSWPQWLVTLPDA